MNVPVFLRRVHWLLLTATVFAFPPLKSDVVGQHDDPLSGTGLASASGGPELTLVNFGRLHRRMPRKEVEAIIGAPTKWWVDQELPEQVAQWEGNEGKAEIRFDATADHRAESGTFFPNDGSNVLLHEKPGASPTEPDVLLSDSSPVSDKPPLHFLSEYWNPLELPVVVLVCTYVLLLIGRVWGAIPAGANPSAGIGRRLFQFLLETVGAVLGVIAGAALGYMATNFCCRLVFERISPRADDVLGWIEWLWFVHFMGLVIGGFVGSAVVKMGARRIGRTRLFTRAQGTKRPPADNRPALPMVLADSGPADPAGPEGTSGTTLAAEGPSTDPRWCFSGDVTAVHDSLALVTASAGFEEGCDGAHRVAFRAEKQQGRSS